MDMLSKKLSRGCLTKRRSSMALIKCPECGREISNKAISCPNCGYPIISKEDNFLSSLKIQSNYNNMISKEKKMKFFRVLAIFCIICWVLLFSWQKTNDSKITEAKATSYTISLESITRIPNTQMSNSQGNLLKINDMVEILKRILIILIILFGILSIYYYSAMKKLK